MCAKGMGVSREQVGTSVWGQGEVSERRSRGEGTGGNKFAQGGAGGLRLGGAHLRLRGSAWGMEKC